MRPSDADGTRFSLYRLGCLAAGLLSLSMLCQPNLAAAADGKGPGVAVLPVVPGNAVDRPPPEVAPGGTLVLRGTRPDNANAGNPNSAPPIPGSTPGIARSAADPPPGSGWDQRFDYSGLDWGPPGPVIGAYR